MNIHFNLVEQQPAGAEDTGGREDKELLLCHKPSCILSYKPPPPPQPHPLCCHLDGIGFSRAGKSNASFKTNCFLLDQLFLSLMCNSFMPSQTHSTHSEGSAYDVREHAVKHSYPSQQWTQQKTSCASTRELIMSGCIIMCSTHGLNFGKKNAISFKFYLCKTIVNYIMNSVLTD